MVRTTNAFSLFGKLEALTDDEVAGVPVRRFTPAGAQGTTV